MVKMFSYSGLLMLIQPSGFMLQKRSRFFFSQLKDQTHLDEINNLLKAFNFGNLPKIRKQKLSLTQGFYTSLSLKKFEEKSPFCHIFTESFL